MPTPRRLGEDLGWIAVGLGALAAAPYVFSYLFVFLTLVASFPFVAMLPLDAMSEGLVEALTMAWMLLALGMSLGLTLAMLFGVARLILRLRTPSPIVYGPSRPPIRR